MQVKIFGSYPARQLHIKWITNMPYFRDKLTAWKAVLEEDTHSMHCVWMGTAKAYEVSNTCKLSRICFRGGLTVK